MVWEGRSREAPPYPDWAGVSSRVRQEVFCRANLLGLRPDMVWRKILRAAGYIYTNTHVSISHYLSIYVLGPVCLLVVCVTSETALAGFPEVRVKDV